MSSLSNASNNLTSLRDDTIASLRRSINMFVINNQLDSCGYNGLKSSMSDRFVPMLDNASNAIMDLLVANQNHKNALEGISQYDVLNMAQIDSEIEQLEATVGRLELLPGMMESVLGEPNLRLEQLRRKKTDFETYLSASRGIYSSAAGSLSSLDSALTTLEFSTFNLSTGRWSIPAVWEVESMVMNRDFSLEVEKILAELIVGDDYNWDLKEEILGQSYSDITPAQYMALAQLLTGMTNPEDLERFIQLLTSPVRVGEIYFAEEGFMDGEGALLRQFNTEIITILEVLMTNNILRNVFSDGDEDQLHHMMQIASILGFIASEPSPFAGEGMNFSTSFLELVADGNGGLTISFTQFGNRAWDSDFNLGAWLNDIDAWNTREITFSEVLFGGDSSLGLRLRDVMGRAAYLRYGVDVSNIFLNALSAYGFDMLSSWLSYIPGVGKVYSGAKSGIDTGIALENFILALGRGYTGEQMEMLRRFNEIDGMLNRYSISDFAQQFSLSGVVISESGVLVPQVSLFPGQGENLSGNQLNTSYAVDGFNDRLNNSSIDIDEFTSSFNEMHETNFQLNDPVSMEDIFMNLPLILQLHEDMLRQ